MMRDIRKNVFQKCKNNNLISIKANISYVNLKEINVAKTIQAYLKLLILSYLKAF